MAQPPSAPPPAAGAFEFNPFTEETPTAISYSGGPVVRASPALAEVPIAEGDTFSANPFQYQPYSEPTAPNAAVASGSSELKFIDGSSSAPSAAPPMAPPPMASQPFHELPVGDGATDALETFRPWNLGYYGFLFDVTSGDVSKRIARSFVPFPNTFFDAVQHNPDLYGPFWIATTAIFVLAATGDFSSFVRKCAGGSCGSWSYDFSRMPYGGTAIYLFYSIVPVVIWALVRFYLRAEDVSIVQLYCFYGYSLCPFIAAAVLCILPWWYLRLLFLVLAFAVSSAFLASNLLRAVPHARLKALPLVAAMVALQALQAAGFFFYFFVF